jgi:hypothetical protein
VFWLDLNVGNMPAKNGKLRKVVQPCFFASISLRSILEKLLVGEGSPIPTERPVRERLHVLREDFASHKKKKGVTLLF